MARTKKKTKMAGIPDDVNVSARPTLDMMENGMEEYAKYVLENRAVPDFRDGLKPVQRRILWAMHGMGMHGGKGEFKKSARVVGETLGKYHPHGDMACYEAMVSMVHLPSQTVVGQGNFGTLLDPAGAMRYTECRLAKYSDKVFFDAAYTPIIELAENFDGSEREPVVLPALLPNLLLNGSFGIGVAARCSIPAFEPEGVMALTQMALKGKEITVDDCMDNLVPRCSEGAQIDMDDPINKEGLRSFFKSGEGRIRWVPDAEGDIDERTVKINGFAPAVAINLSSSLNKVNNEDTVQSCVDESDVKSGMSYKVTLKQNSAVAKRSVQPLLEKICGFFSSNQSLAFTVTRRFPPEEGEAKVDVAFSYMTMPEFFRLWAKWRIVVERRAIKHRKGVLDKRLAHDELLVKAALNRDAVRQSWEEKDPVQYLMRKLKISEDGAKVIRELRIRQLDALEERNLRKRIKEIKVELRTLKADFADPVPRVVGAMDDLMAIA